MLDILKKFGLYLQRAYRIYCTQLHTYTGTRFADRIIHSYTLDNNSSTEVTNSHYKQSIHNLFSLVLFDVGIIDWMNRSFEMLFYALESHQNVSKCVHRHLLNSKTYTQTWYMIPFLNWICTIHKPYFNNIHVKIIPWNENVNNLIQLVWKSHSETNKWSTGAPNNLCYKNEKK